MALSQYLKDEKIDQIEDDQEFCHKEYEAIVNYFLEFEVTEEDIKELEARGYEESQFVDCDCDIEEA